jgi:hypothetical protein
MKKVVLSIAAVLMFVVIANATEPSGAVWTGSISITSIYVGDYNVTNGKVYVTCNDGKAYWFNLGTELAKTMYTTALSAFTAGKKINILKPNVTTSEIQMYRIQILLN